MELNKNFFAAVFILFIVFAVHPAFSRGRLKLKNEKLNSEIYEIDYRGPETHSYRPPPNGAGRGNSNGRGPLQNPKMHGPSKRLSAENLIVNKPHE